MRYAGYLFDLDGTLVDTAPDIHVALNLALGRHGLPTIDEAHTRHWIGHGARALISEALGEFEVPDSRLDAVLADFIEHYRAHIADASRPYPGVVDTLESLRSGGAKLAVVTNKRTSLTQPLLKALDLDRWFQAVICGDTAAEPKPHPAPARLALSELLLPAESALFVGDSETDVLCARAAGCPVVVVRDGYNHGIPAAELGADAVIESFSELV